ncbi:mrna cleavage factor complex component [Lichtheimia corymbifera JMRC:FSU:9682]|uniref:Mrna cleavage factor complex component n=1 Tax=Lichtheimia corymbifera JMRC:FSU:9682 TaxID=1263082 RepID=A0A068RWP4_9FUNG|nr:mrna cleavage factor complex component [Lichtheimia corymbifera JMRC:FSU:9682]
MNYDASIMPIFCLPPRPPSYSSFIIVVVTSINSLGLPIVEISPMSLPNNMPTMSTFGQHPSSKQPQQPGFTQDPETARRNYRQALYELTFNSKPIITNLTIMAQENQHVAGAIVREIEQQIRHNAPGQKLPILYLIDSICKNVGGVYIDHFARNIVSTFMDAYTLTDPQTRRSFERLLQTWKNGLPNGHPVFSRHVIESIERPVNYMRERQGAQPMHQSPRPKHPLPQQQQQQQQQQQRNQHIHVNPNFVPAPGSRDPRTRSDYSDRQRQQQPSYNMTPPAKQDSPTAKSNGPKEGPQQLSQLFSQIQAILPGLPATQAATFQHQIDQIMSAPPAQTGRLSYAPTSAAATPPLPPPTSIPPQQQHAPSTTSHMAEAKGTPPMGAPFPSTATTSEPKAPAINTAELLQGLTSLGILQGGTPSNVVSTPTPPPMIQEQQHGSISTPPQHSTTAGIRLESKDLQIARPGAVEVLYSGLPLQCKQCGFRYPKTEQGQSKMDAHLDSHFRQNRRMKERVKRGLSRSWFVTEDEWISGAGGELASHQAPTFLTDSTSGSGNAHQHGNVGGSPSAQAGSETIGPDSQMVVMPDENNRKPCPICGERFVDFWNDDEEEWMYKNAVLVDNTIYHATCHADAVKSGTLMSDHGDDDNDAVSNALTTMLSDHGVKRKHESYADDEGAVKIPRTDLAYDVK